MAIVQMICLPELGVLLNDSAATLINGCEGCINLRCKPEQHQGFTCSGLR